MTSVIPILPSEVGFSDNMFKRLDSTIKTAISSGTTPGMSLAIGRRDKIVLTKGYGRLDWNKNSAKVDQNTLYDLASVTKVVGTTIVAMILEEEGKLDLNHTVASYLPQFNSPEKAGITIYQLLIHKSGFENFAPLYKIIKGRDKYLQQINLRPLKYSPGTTTMYSDWNMLIAQLVIEKITGQNLDVFLYNRVYKPLQMLNTIFNPNKKLSTKTIKNSVAPTEIQNFRGGKIWGEVHDENAWAMGGVSGHAGLFSTASDLAILATLMLNEGKYKNVQLLKPATIERWTKRQSPDSNHAIGWNTPWIKSNTGKYFSPNSFGHNGFTGTSFWIDSARNLFIIILSNNVNPKRDNPKIKQLRSSISDIVQESVKDLPLVNWEKILGPI